MKTQLIAIHCFALLSLILTHSIFAQKLSPGSTYRNNSGSNRFTIISNSELDFYDESLKSTFVCDYTYVGEKIRVVVDSILGKQAFYFTFHEKGLLGPNNVLFYSEEAFNEKQANFKKFFTDPNHWYTGNSLTQKIGPERTQFKICFTSYDDNSNKLTAIRNIVSIKSMATPNTPNAKFKMEGQINGESLTMKDVGRNFVWKLKLQTINGQPTLKGTQNEGLASGNVTIELSSKGLGDISPNSTTALKPKETVKPSGVKIEATPSSPVLEPTTKLEKLTHQIQNASLFNQHNYEIDKELSQVWKAVINVLESQKEKGIQSDANSGLITTDITRHGSFLPKHDQYLVFLEPVGKNTNIQLKLITYYVKRDQNSKTVLAPELEKKFVNRRAEKFYRAILKELR